jgi:Fic family protein
MYEKKYNMTAADNIEYAKRNIVDYIYKSARLEGLSVTFPDTDAIYNGIVPRSGNVTVDDVTAINNLKHAWQFLFDTVDMPFSYAYICKLHQYVGDGQLIYNAGFIRQFDVSVGGTEWKPEIPIESMVKEKIESINGMVNPIERALSMTMYLMRSQLFFDGNKRTAMLAGNKIMIKSGGGIISVPEKDLSVFTTKLVKYYETDEPDDLMNYLYNNCIDGANFIPINEISQYETPPPPRRR